MINGQSYNLDSSCSVVVNTLGETACTSTPLSTTESASVPSTAVTSNESRSPTIYELVSVVGVGLVLFLVTITLICLIAFFIRRKSRKYAVTKHRRR